MLSLFPNSFDKFNKTGALMKDSLFRALSSEDKVSYLSIQHSIIRESPPKFENRIMAKVYVRSITRSTMYQKAPFC